MTSLNFFPYNRLLCYYLIHKYSPSNVDGKFKASKYYGNLSFISINGCFRKMTLFLWIFPYPIFIKYIVTFDLSNSVMWDWCAMYFTCILHFKFYCMQMLPNFFFSGGGGGYCQWFICYRKIISTKVHNNNVYKNFSYNVHKKISC